MKEKYHELLRDTKLYLLEKKHSFIYFEASSLVQNSVKVPAINKPEAVIEEPAPISKAPPFLPPVEIPPQKPIQVEAVIEKKKEEPKEEKAPEETLPISKKVESTFDYLEDVKKEMQKLFPSLSIIEPISDKDAKRIANSYAYKNQAAPITILSSTNKKEDLKFLEGVAKAISNYFFPCRVVDSFQMEEKNRWKTFLSAPQIKLVIACDYTVLQQKALTPHFKEIASKSEHYLDDIPLFLLPDLSIYFKDPSLKRSLWMALCKKIAALPKSS